MAFLIGVVSVQQLAQLPSAGWLLLALLPVTALLPGRPRLVPLLFMLLGATWSIYVANGLLQQSVPRELEKKTVTVTGEVVGLPIRHRHGIRFDFRIDQAYYKNKSVSLPRRVRLGFYRKLSTPPWTPLAGSRWRLRVRLKNPHGFQNPGGFDYEAHLFANRIRATGYIAPKTTRIRLGDAAGQGFNRLRQRISNRMRTILAAHDQLGIVTALANGDRQELTAHHWQVLKQTGTSHLVAISGLHLSLVSGLVFLCCRFGWGAFGYGVRRLPAQKLAAILALASAVVYAGLAGFSIPTQRALLMLGAVYAAILFSRQPLRLQALATALLLVLIYDPLSVLSPGFWLSFTAVTIIYFISTGRENAVRWRQGFRLQWAIAIGLMPITLLFFQSTSLVSPLANLVAIPIFGLVVVPLTLAGLISLVLLPDVVASFLLHLAASVSAIGWHWLEWVGSLAPTTMQLPAPGLLAAGLAMTGLALLALPAGTPSRWIGLVWCLPLLWTPRPPPVGDFQASLLDVGQGLSLVVRTRNHLLVFDTGARFSERLDTGEAVVLPFLRQQGLSRIDTMVISHDDNDHIGGLESIRGAMRIGNLISNVPVAAASEPCARGTTWVWEGVRFTILHPQAGAGGDHNNDSCVLMVAGRHAKLLAPGDIEKQAELELVREYGSSLRADYLIAPHHGSHTSSTTEFLDAVHPGWVLIPAGHLNRYHHPSKTVTRRYSAQGVKWLVSGQEGAIRIETAANLAIPHAYRASHRRYWHNPTATED